MVAHPRTPPRWVDRFQAVWRGKGILFWGLVVLSWAYQAVLGLRRRAYKIGLVKTVSLPVPVIVVGNVVAGGAGKTPTVIALVTHLRQQGWQVGVISRGYGRNDTQCQLVQANSLAAQVGDEPLLMYHRCQVPVAVATKRSEAARMLLARFPTTQLLVCDDGLQHLALPRYLEIVVFDDRGVGNGRLLPAGWLREPWPRHADLVLHTGLNPQDVGMPGFIGTRRLAPTLRNGRGQTCQLHALPSQRVCALAAIAHPNRFFDMLRQQGVTLIASQALPDHADLSQWQAPPDWPPLDLLTVLCTEKDAYKIWERHPGVWAVALMFEPEPAFFDALDARLPPVIAPAGSQ